MGYSGFLAGPSLGPAQQGGGGFQIPSWLGPAIGAGFDIYRGLNQDQQAAANYQMQQQRMQMMMGLLGPMFQGGPNPYEQQVSQMLGINPGGQQANPWFGGGGGGGGQQTPSGQPIVQAPPPGSGSGPWYDPAGTGRRTGSGGSILNRPGSNLAYSRDMEFLPGGIQPLTNPQVPFGGGGNEPFHGGNSGPGFMPPPRVHPGFQPVGQGGAGFTNPNGLGYTSGQYSSGEYAPERIDVNSLMQNSGSMRGQDALFQMLNRDPAGQMVNAQDLIGANTELFNRQTDRSADLLRGRARGLGQFAGTAAANAEALMRGDANAQLGAQNAGLLYNTATGNADRSLNLYGQRIGGYGTLGQMGAQSGDQMLRAMLANQQAGIGANQFNIGNRNAANQFNIANQNQANQFGIQTYLNTLFNAQNMGQQRNQYNLDLASLFGGLPVPQRNSQYNALGAAGEAAWVPWFMGQMGR